MSWDENRLELEIADDGCGPGGQRNGRVGHGLVGMRERAALHQGWVRAGAERGGGYRVQASLPLIARDLG
jgi:signal transduction histidine kinase